MLIGAFQHKGIESHPLGHGQLICRLAGRPMCLPTHRFRNFLGIENRTITCISRDTATFVQEEQNIIVF